MEKLKLLVKEFWERETCGTRYGDSLDKKKFYEQTAEARYQLEPYILDFAEFERNQGKKILEIGVGSGADFHRWIVAGHSPVGIDLTMAGIKHTKARLDAFDVSPQSYSLICCDAEYLPFRSSSFDLVYSWGVLHHSPDTEKCFKEVFRILKSGGEFKAMIYHRPSWTGLMLWIRYALLSGRFWLSEKDVVSEHLESPGTKVFTKSEARNMLVKCGFSEIKLRTVLSGGDLLNIKPSKKYQSLFYALIWKLYPRWLIKRLGNKLGLFLLIDARKKE